MRFSREREREREREGQGGRRDGERRERKDKREVERRRMTNEPTYPIRKEWAAHFPVRNLNALSAYPVIVNPTHYVGDEGWFSDTEPPPEVLAQIRERKKREMAEEKRKEMEKKAHQDKVKDEAMKRQIESMRAKLKSKTEL